MKHKKFSIKWKIFFYLLSFVLVLLIVLWLIQTVYLDEFYKNIKINEIDDAMSTVVENMNAADLEERIASISEQYNICVLIADEEGNKVYSSDGNMGCTIHKINNSIIKQYFITAKKDGGILRLDVQPENKKSDYQAGFPDSNKNPMEQPNGMVNSSDWRELDRNDWPLFKNPDMNEVESVILARYIVNDEGDELIILLNTLITPLDATVNTIKIQLIYISIILVVLSLIIALLVSRRISKSIIKINQSAKELAKGNFDITFTGHDYKEIAELSDTLNITAEELAKAELLQKELIANVSHDLRTPLTMITAYSEIMRDIPEENTPENVQIIIDEAKRLTILVNDLLDISKLQAGVNELDIKEYDLTESIKSVINRYAKLVEQDGYIIEFEYDCNILVNADEFKIYQVIYNLMNNAINYTGEDKTVRVRQLVNGNIVRIEVCDSGEGIPESERTNVWKRYYKAKKNHKRAITGSGLGLDIVKNILKLHKTQFGVNSKVRVGSVFWFELKINNR